MRRTNNSGTLLYGRVGIIPVWPGQVQRMSDVLNLAGDLLAGRLDATPTLTRELYSF
jgi:hypothetical protein